MVKEREGWREDKVRKGRGRKVRNCEEGNRVGGEKRRDRRR